MNSNEIDADGLRVRREVLGPEYVDGSINDPDPANQRFQAYVTNSCWGKVWVDDTLSRRERSLLTLAIAAALGHTAELALHLRGALNNGITHEELGAVVEHIGVYAGMPAAVSARRELKALSGAEE